MVAVTICSDFRAPQIKSVTVSTVSPSICDEVMGPEIGAALGCCAALEQQAVERRYPMSKVRETPVRQ